MRKIIVMGLAVMVIVCLAVGCVGTGSNSSAGGASSENGLTGTATGISGKITVVSREEGSGTRGAFIELFGIEEKDENGKKVDNTTLSAEITNSTAVMMTNIAGNVNAIGYVSLGSVNDTVKTLKIDGTLASAENIKNGEYKVSRPFNIVTKEGLSDAAEDFISFILSDEGQKVVEEAGYISEGSTGAYSGSNQSGKITVAGSSSVTPVMEKLKEAYIEKNPDVKIEVQQNDSTTGVASVAEGICDIGMASRELKDSELEKGLKPQVIALDGIAVIVNKDSSVNSLTSEQVKNIFTGVVTDWSEINWN